MMKTLSHAPRVLRDYDAEMASLLSRMAKSDAKVLVTASIVKRPQAEIELAHVMEDMRVFLKERLEGSTHSRAEMQSAADGLSTVREYCTKHKFSPVCDHFRVDCLKEVEKMQAVTSRSRSRMRGGGFIRAGAMGARHPLQMRKARKRMEELDSNPEAMTQKSTARERRNRLKAAGIKRAKGGEASDCDASRSEVSECSDE